MLSQTQYRSDIDGLRAIAVLAVVFYHYRITPFSGGYVGVDVFFVISGYLITSLIIGEIQSDQFSVVRFYERRVRRIFPALFFMLSITATAGLVLLLPDDLGRFGKSLLATTIFSSNFEFWRETGYFDVASALKPLLHTWSLAVEEQFYLFFPWLLVILRKQSLGTLLWYLALISAGSFALNAWTVDSHPQFAFFLAPTRIWELLVGGMLAIAGLRAPNDPYIVNGVGFLGIGLVGYSVFVFTGETPFPGFAALLPCVGTICIIYTGTSRYSLINWLISRPPVVFVGLISYSLYLWHWPVWVFGNYYQLTGTNGVQTGSLIGISVVLAVFSWKFIERPFRGLNPLLPRQSLFRLSAAVAATTAGVGAAAFILQGLPQRFSPDVLNVLSVARETPRPQMSCKTNASGDVAAANLCEIGNDESAKPSFLLWGDSLSYALLPAIEAVAEEQHRVGVSAEHDGCPPLLGVRRSDIGGCPEFNDAAYKVAQDKNIREIILVSRWAINSESTRYRNEPGSRDILVEVGAKGDTSTPDNHEVFARALSATIEKLRKAGKKVVFVHSTPEIGYAVPEVLVKQRRVGGNAAIAPSWKDYLERQSFVFSTVNRLKMEYGISVADPSAVLCASGDCVVEISGRPIYRDDHHLSVFGAMQLVPLLATVM